MCKASELFSITVQQFFQLRVQEWVDTVGKEGMDIEFYWGRFEFTKGYQSHNHATTHANTQTQCKPR